MATNSKLCQIQIFQKGRVVLHSKNSLVDQLHSEKLCFGHYQLYLHLLSPMMIQQNNRRKSKLEDRCQEGRSVYLCCCFCYYCYCYNDYLNSTTNDLCELFQRKGLYFIPVNARSLLSRVMEIRVLANHTNAAVICVTETWFDSSVTDTEVEIPGYLIQRRDRSRSGGSVCMYIRSDLAFNPRHDLTVEELENIWVEILLPKTKPILVCVLSSPETN